MCSKSLCRVLCIAIILILFTLLSLSYVQHISQAQGPISVTKTLNRSTNVVRVGEALTFTIALTNNSAFTLTGMNLIDDYDNTTLAFSHAVPAPTGHIASTALITWNNLVPIPPGQSVYVTLVFIAEHPRTTVVNAARAEDLVNSSGMLTQTAETSQTQEAVGGAAPVVKFLSPPGSEPLAGLPITFTHVITNDGAALMIHLPLTDTYDADFLEFNYALPFTPNIITPPGTLVWTNLASPACFGPIPGDTAVVITTVFTATTQVLNTVNEASTEGALDVYNNDLTAGAAQVPITIIGNTPTPSPAPTQEDEDDDDEDDDDDDDDDVPTPTIPAPTFTPTPAATLVAEFVAPDSNKPVYLPETGQSQTGWLIALLIGLSLLTLGWYLFRIKETG
jgi:LPXTG-motif cell wall-anchored protein/uncharacterized repeat protein (TIGR01451 family)